MLHYIEGLSSYTQRIKSQNILGPVYRMGGAYEISHVSGIKSRLTQGCGSMTDAQCRVQMCLCEVVRNVLRDYDGIGCRRQSN